MKLKSGEKYIGQWKDGFRNGTGSEYDSGGKLVRKGRFVNDSYVLSE